MLFEVPTGVVADTRGRRFSYLLGTATLLVSTLLYLWMWQAHAPLWGWAIASILLGLGFTFFSGATEAWLVDALKATGFTGHLERIFGRAQVVGGIAMLVGTVSGGVIAQATNLGVPYIVRAAMLGVTLLVAFRFMHDLGFKPDRDSSPAKAVRNVISGADRWRLPQSTGPLAHARGAVHVRRRDLRLLRVAALSARALRRPDRVRRRRPGGRDRRRRADPRRSPRLADPSAVQPADRPPSCSPRSSTSSCWCSSG